MSRDTFDPELYLRLIGEREIAPGLDIEHQRLNGRGRLHAAAAALVIAGVIDRQLAESLTSDYSMASSLQRGQTDLQQRRMMRMHQAAAAYADPKPLAPRRVFVLDDTLTVASGELHARALTLSKDGGELTASLRWAAGRPHPQPGQFSLGIRGPGAGKTTASFSGGWSENSIDGTFSIDSAVEPDADWIEIEGHRIDLPESTQPPQFTIEPVAPARVHMHYLWQLMADAGDRHSVGGGGVLPAAEALIAAGLIDEQDAELEAVLWVADGNRGARYNLTGPPVRPQSSARPAMPAALPEEWRSFLSRQVAGPSPEGSISIAAVSPLFDGISVAVNALESGANGCRLRVEATGIPHSHFLSTVAHKPVAWWTIDDLGNHDLGHLGTSSSSNNHMTGELTFGNLNPRATRLTIVVASLTARAQVTVPLEWES